MWAPLLLFATHTAVSGMSLSILGTDCQTSVGTNGSCIRRSECQWALEELKLGRRPKYCLNSLPTVIVCCPADGATTPSDDLPPPGLMSNRSKAVGDVARRKCKEYGELVYQEVEVPALIARRERRSQCVSTVKSLIVGGSKAEAKEFPHMALLGCRCGSSHLDCDGDLNFFCGGSLISPNFILTAAHCLYARNKTVQLVLLGSLDRINMTEADYEQLIGVAERIPHPKYTSSSTYHDIALLRLESDAVLSGHVRPACLHTGEPMDQQAVPVATGWGFTDLVGEPSDVLKKVGLRLVADDACRSSYASHNPTRLANGIDSASQLCAGGELNRDTCFGDSGGPLQVYATNTTQTPDEPFCMYKILGVTSFSKFACGLKDPGVYTRVSSYVAWIENIVWPQQ
ncbi:serine protease snake-like [Thrips palmi]|uniref:Serine protease snake-like n=1 Tax=Thrips palmi TaxID=161013 RepID=A0A6P8ZA81_THRPL|nr:serine protease snake-like [Thrips palmi]